MAFMKPTCKTCRRDETEVKVYSHGLGYKCVDCLHEESEGPGRGWFLTILYLLIIALVAAAAYYLKNRFQIQ